MKEIWKNIPGYVDFYQISNKGRVKSLDRLDNFGRKRGGRILKLQTFKGKNLMVSLSKNNKKYYYRVPRLILLAFKGPCPKKMECCHNDGDSGNNALYNLRWDTHKNNEADKIKHGTSNLGKRLSEKTKQKLSLANKGRKHSEETKRKIKKNHVDCSGEKSGRAKLTWVKVKKIRLWHITNKITCRELGEKFNVSLSCISRITNNKTWKA